jgi:hypothetical protein
MRRPRLSAAFAILVALFACAGVAWGDDESQNVILAKVQPDTVLIWKINAAVSELLELGVTGEAFNDALLSRAERIMSDRARGQRGKASRITLQMVYFQDGGADPRYRVETVAGINRIGSLSATMDDVARLGADWIKELATGQTPPQLHIDVNRALLNQLQTH